jgi:NAD(P)-dependent dehydrogenase (short-subunit alcohol dehydrogenase family)
LEIDMSARLQPAQKQEHQPGREDKMSPRPEYTPKYPGCGKLKEKVALITGGDSGVGRAVAVAMAREGAKIAIVYLEEHKDADETLAAVQREGGRAIKIAGDVADESVCQVAVDKTVKEFGRLDILVNNAGEQHETDDPRKMPPRGRSSLSRVLCPKLWSGTVSASTRWRRGRSGRR